MVDIHFCGPDDQPLCRQVSGDRWLWTAVPQAVTCPGCGLLLDRQHRIEPPLHGEDPVTGKASKRDRDEGCSVGSDACGSGAA